MKKTILIGAIALAFALTSTAHAGPAAGSANQNISTQGMVSIPVVFKLMMENKSNINLTKPLIKQLKTDVRGKYSDKKHNLMDKIIAADKKLAAKILIDGKTFAQMEADLVNLSKMRMDLTQIQVAAMKDIKGVIGDYRWNQLMDIIKDDEHKHKGHSHSH